MSFVRQTYVPFLNRKIVKTSIAVGAMIFLALCLYSASLMTVGFKDEDRINREHGTTNHVWYSTYMKHWTVHDSRLYFKAIDYPSRQVDIIELIDAVVASRYADVSGYPAWLTVFYAIIGAMSSVPLDNATVDALGLADGSTYAALGWSLDTVYTNPTWAPSGIISASAESFYTMFGALFSPPGEFDSVDPSGTYAIGDSIGMSSFGLRDRQGTVSAQNPIVLSHIFFMCVNTRLFADFVDANDEIRGLIDSSPLKGDAFPSGYPFVLPEIMANLSVVFWALLAADFVIIFLISWVLLQSLRSAIISMMVCCVIVCETFGLFSLYMALNPFSVVFIFMSVGLSIEFTAHIIVAFESSLGSCADRVTSSLTLVLPAVSIGVFSTFVSIISLAFAETKVAVLYCFLGFSIVLLIGFVHSVLILPVMLLIIGGNKTGTKADPAEAMDGTATSENDQNIISVVSVDVQLPAEQ